MPDIKKRKILIIDDEVALLGVMKTNLEIEGYEVLTEMSGETGFVSAVVEQPDVIILDILMPGVDGFEVCRRLRAEPRTRYIPVVILTALDETRDVVRGFESGADDYLAKPFQTPELFARIRSVLTKASRGMAVDPLTHLPGKQQIYEETRLRLEQRGRFFAFIYLDISNLRVVNDNFGIEKGDELILGVANSLREVVMAEEEFLGYMGEDDFVVLTVPLRVTQIFDGVTARFDSLAPGLCPGLNSAAGPGAHDLVKLALAVVTNERRQFADPLQVKNVALEVLKHARARSCHYCADLKDYPI